MAPQAEKALQEAGKNKNHHFNRSFGCFPSRINALLYVLEAF